jgi:hypothetical protein
MWVLLVFDVLRRSPGASLYSPKKITQAEQNQAGIKGGNIAILYIV